MLWYHYLGLPPLSFFISILGIWFLLTMPLLPWDGALGHCQNQHMNKFHALLNGTFQAWVDGQQLHEYESSVLSWCISLLLTGLLSQAFQVLRSLGVTVQMISQGASKVYTLSTIELYLSPSIYSSTAKNIYTKKINQFKAFHPLIYHRH